MLGDLGAAVDRVVPPERRRPDGKRRTGVERRQAGAPARSRRRRARRPPAATPTSSSTRRTCPARTCSIRRVRPHAVWVHVTPFGIDGPRANWRASNLGVMAASGNMYCTGDPDRAPVRCAEPTGYAHSGARGRVRRARPRCGRESRRRSTCRCKRSSSAPAWRRPPTSRAPASRGRRAGRQHRPDPRDLADDSTASSRSACGAARRGSRASS